MCSSVTEEGVYSSGCMETGQKYNCFASFRCVPRHGLSSYKSVKVCWGPLGGGENEEWKKALFPPLNIAFVLEVEPSGVFGLLFASQEVDGRCTHVNISWQKNRPPSSLELLLDIVQVYCCSCPPPSSYVSLLFLVKYQLLEQVESVSAQKSFTG